MLLTPLSFVLTSRWISGALLHGFAGIATIATLLGCLGTAWWGFGLLDHPRPQYCLLLLPALVWGGIWRQPWSLVWLVPLMVNLGLMAPLFIQVDTKGNGSAPVLHLLHANLDRHNATPAKAVQFLNQQTVDLLFVQEVTPEWLSRLQTELTHYRVVRAEPRSNSHGSALFVPVSVPIAATPPIAILDTQTIHLPATSDRPLLETRIRWAGQEISILSLHVIRPRSPETANYQQTEFAAVAAWSQFHHQHDRHVVVLGDFNSTPWSRPFRLLVHQSGLVNSQRGFGLQPTWRAGFPAMLMIPIDHCLHNAALTTIKRTIGANIGSDHLPLLVDVVPKSAAAIPKGTG